MLPEIQGTVRLVAVVVAAAMLPYPWHKGEDFAAVAVAFADTAAGLPSLMCLPWWTKMKMTSLRYWAQRIEKLVSINPPKMLTLQDPLVCSKIHHSFCHCL